MLTYVHSLYCESEPRRYYVLCCCGVACGSIFFFDFKGTCSYIVHHTFRIETCTCP